MECDINTKNSNRENMVIKTQTASLRAPHSSTPILWRWGDYLFILRPTLWFPIWTLLLCGANGGSIMGGDPIRIALSILGLSALLGVVYLANQIRDVHSDLINDKLHFICKGFFSIRAAQIYLGVLFIIGMSALLLIGRYWMLIVVTLNVLITGLLYNLGRFALKNSPWGSVAATFFGGAGTFFIGQTLVDPAPQWHPLLIIGYAFAFTATGMLTMIPDMKGDHEAHKVTIVVRHGAAGTARIALIFCTLAFVAALLEKNLVLIASAGISLPFFLWTAIRGKENAAIATVKISILALSLAVGIFYYPIYPIIIIVYYFLARFYYWRRFRLKYPSLSFHK